MTCYGVTSCPLNQKKFPADCSVIFPQMMVVWNTRNVVKGGEVAILAKAHTDVDISTMKIAFFDDTRYPAHSLLKFVIHFASRPCMHANIFYLGISLCICNPI